MSIARNRRTSERLEVTQLVANKAHSDATTAKEEASKFKADYVADVGRCRDEAGGTARQVGIA